MMNTVVITGSAGGMGGAAAKLFQSKGFTVIGLDLKPSENAITHLLVMSMTKKSGKRFPIVFRAIICRYLHSLILLEETILMR